MSIRLERRLISWVLLCAPLPLSLRPSPYLSSFDTPSDIILLIVSSREMRAQPETSRLDNESHGLSRVSLSVHMVTSVVSRDLVRVCVCVCVHGHASLLLLLCVGLPAVLSAKNESNRHAITPPRLDDQLLCNCLSLQRQLMWINSCLCAACLTVSLSLCSFSSVFTFIWIFLCLHCRTAALANPAN